MGGLRNEMHKKIYVPSVKILGLPRPRAFYSLGSTYDLRRGGGAVAHSRGNGRPGLLAGCGLGWVRSNNKTTIGKEYIKN